MGKKIFGISSGGELTRTHCTQKHNWSLIETGRIGDVYFPHIHVNTYVCTYIHM